MKRREALALAGVAGAGLAISEGINGSLLSGRPSRAVAPGPDVGRAINQAISELAAEGGGIVSLGDGVYGTTLPLKLLSNVSLVGSGKTVIKAMDAIGDGGLRRSLIECPRNSDNIGIADLTINCDGKVSYAAWYAVGARGLDCRNVNVTGWNFGFYFTSSEERGAEHIAIKNTVVRAGGPVQVYPVFISSQIGRKPVRNVVLEDLKISGPKGSYSATNAATADQLALQNVHGFTLRRVESYGAGENGIVIVRGCRDGLLEDVVAAGSDGHGLQIGGGGVVATLDNGSAFNRGEEVQGLSSEGKAKVDKVSGDDVWLSRLTRRQLRIGEALRGPGGSATIKELGYCKNIRVDGFTARGNGRNAGRVRGKFADLYISHAEEISLENLDLSSTAPALSILINNSRNIPCNVGRGRNSSTELHAGKVDCEA